MACGIIGHIHHGCWTSTALDWLWTSWTPYQNGHRTPVNLSQLFTENRFHVTLRIVNPYICKQC